MFIFVENHAINTECKDIADKLVDNLNTNRNPKKIKINNDLELFAYIDYNNLFYKGTFLNNNDIVKIIQFKNKNDLAKEIALLI